MATVVSNQLTFLDMTDQGKKLSIYLTSNMPLIQMRDSSRTIYNPSWVDMPLKIELRAFLDQVEIGTDDTSLTIKWYFKDGNNDKTVIDGQTGGILEVSENVLGKSTSMRTYICEVSYSGVEKPVESQLTYTLIDEIKGDTGVSAVTFQIYAPDGNVFYNGQPEKLSIQAIGYKGIDEITSGATYTWEKYTGDYEVVLDGSSNTYDVTYSEVVNVQTYRCTMHYENNDYIAVITFEDKSDTYVSEMLTIGGTVFKNGQGGSAVYVIVRTNGKEVDQFPDGCSIGKDYPANPTKDMYWWLLSDNAVTLRKYDGSSWNIATDDPQEFDYIWSLMDQNGDDVEFERHGKVIYLSCSEIQGIGTLQCDVHKKEQ